jgi:hypothetical protein
VREVCGSGRVAGAAADDEAAAWAAPGCYFLDVVGAQVGRGVGGAALPARTPVAHDGAVVGHNATASLSFSGVGVEVGASYPLGLVQAGLAVTASGLATYLPAAVEAGAEQGPGHRGLRLRRSRSWSR